MFEAWASSASNSPSYTAGMQASDQYTDDVDRADVIFVDDYCFMMSHTGTFHGGGFADGFDPSAELQKAYNKLASWPR